MRLRPDREGHIEAILEGPAHPLKPEAPALNTELVLNPAGEKPRIRLGDADIQLSPGEWSDWITVSFKYFGPASVKGIVRVYLLSAYPRVQLYVSPVHIDPRDPVVPLSSPPDYAAEMETRQSMPCIPRADRTCSFETVELGFTEASALAEASRCRDCDARQFEVVLFGDGCKECSYCAEVCSQEVFEPADSFNEKGYRPM